MIGLGFIAWRLQGVQGATLTETKFPNTQPLKLFGFL